MSAKEQRALKAKYRLHLWHLPRLAFEQKQKDLERTREILNLKAQLGIETAKDRSVFLLEPAKLVSEKIERSKFVNSLKALWEEVHVTEGSLLRRISGTGINVSHKIKSFSWLDSASKFFVKYANLYHECLQQLVEGHREVTQDKSTLLEDGETVDEKLKRFEASLKEHMPKSSKDGRQIF